MSSFVLLRQDLQPLRIGNPTFKRILRKMEEEKHSIAAIARIAGGNPIADCTGMLTLDNASGEDIKAFSQMVNHLLEEAGLHPVTESGFNVHEDLLRFVGELQERLGGGSGHETP